MNFTQKCGKNQTRSDLSTTHTFSLDIQYSFKAKIENPTARFLKWKQTRVQNTLKHLGFRGIKITPIKKKTSQLSTPLLGLSFDSAILSSFD